MLLQGMHLAGERPPRRRRALRAPSLALLLAALALLCRAPAARADDCISPSSDVVNGVTVRAAPNTQGQKLGVLARGQTLPLVASVPNWYQTLLNGTTAYVSKHWTDIGPCAAPAPAAPTQIQFELHAIDVGTGLPIFVRGPDFTLLYDAGSNDDLARGPGNRTLAYLRTVTPAVTGLDHVILSHPHRDHLELLPDVLAQLAPRDVWEPGAHVDICGYRHFLQALAAAPAIRYHTANQNFGNESVSLAAVADCYGHPEPAQALSIVHASRIDHTAVPLGATASMSFLYIDGTHKANPNDNSLVTRLDLGDHRVLLTGDAQAGNRAAPDTAPSAGSIEAALLACCAADLRADLLIVGHHGSKTSSRTAFLDAVGAKTFIVSSGPTKYGTVVLPDAEVIAELKSRGQLFRTDLDDAACAAQTAKVGPDNDGKAGGCDNILVKLTTGAPLSVDYRRLAD